MIGQTISDFRFATRSAFADCQLSGRSRSHLDTTIRLAIAICGKVASDNTAFAPAHLCLANAYWAKRMYPQVIEQWKAAGQLFGDRNDSEFASAVEGFHSAGWKGALTKGIETREAQRKTEYYSAYLIGSFVCRFGTERSHFPVAQHRLLRAR